MRETNKTGRRRKRSGGLNGKKCNIMMTNSERDGDNDDDDDEMRWQLLLLLRKQKQKQISSYNQII